jgi:membrane-associated HD superfamily phosphohydrolase
VENQLDNKNLHDSIEPEQSAKIIVDHVNEGINLAKKHKLPQEVIKFIPMHHGTMAVSYFYEKAKEEYGEDKIDINNFRYPGPKPDSKETALLMMADACESTVRSMSDPDAKKIENVVNNIIKLRVDDGQLDEAPITMRDITLIKESFFSILLSQYHKRIRYPEQEKIENESNDIEV